jgi:hypothetical protein
MSAFASPRVCSLALLAALSAMPSRLVAQVSDQYADANSYRTDAFFGTPNVYGPTPPANIFATTPGLEQQARRSQFTINGLAPLFYNSNPAALATGGTSSAEFSPVLGVSWSTPVLDLPFRFTANVRAEVDRFTQFPGLDFDKVAASARLQYVDANNDQAYSPYIAYSPRWDFAPFYRSWFDTRQDLNFGVNKIFNFDAGFQRVAFSGDTFGQTVWSFGVTAVIQRRFRDPAPGSWAAILVPSMTYVISSALNLSAGVALERRAFDSYYDFNQEDWLVEPILTLEFVLPESWFGSAGTAALLGRPAIDFQAAYEKNWSNLPAANFSAWHLGVAMKLGWRF